MTAKLALLISTLLKTSAFIALLTLYALLPTNLIYAASQPKGTLKQCLQIYSKIESLDDKRRAGGSTKQMNKWKIKRDKLSTKAYRLNCRKYGVLR